MKDKRVITAGRTKKDTVPFLATIAVFDNIECDFASLNKNN